MSDVQLYCLRIYYLLVYHKLKALLPFAVFGVIVVLMSSPAFGITLKHRAHGEHNLAAPIKPATMSKLLDDLCSKKVVPLGEDRHHGSGKTLEAKTQILRNLVSRCGFNAVLFESSFYEFVNLQHVIANGTLTSKMLADAIGPLWSESEESRPLIDFLSDEIASGRLRVGGLDPQMGSRTGIYAQERLARDLTTYLRKKKNQSSCLTKLSRHDRWGYDSRHPFDASAKASLRACVASIRLVLSKLQRTRDVIEATAMARSYASYLKMVQGNRGARDHAMFKNLQWFKRWSRKFEQHDKWLTCS